MRCLLIVILLLYSVVTCGQTLPEDVRLRLEELAEEQEELDVTELVLQLQKYADNPLNINNSSMAEWQNFPFLSQEALQSIIRYRSERGGFQSLYELQAIRALDMSTIHLLRPFITLDEYREREQAMEQQILVGYSQLFQKQKGYLEGEYKGIPLKNDFRYQAKYKHMGWGALTEKDAGEYFFDFKSAYVQFLKNEKWNLLLGDYEVRMGQGLLIRQGLSMGKSSEVLNLQKRGPFLRPHRSVAEYGYLRGLAAQYYLNDWSFSLFTSYNKIDANIVDTVDGVLIASSYLAGGLHRTANELADKNRLKEQLIGGQLQFQHKHFRFAFSGMYVSVEGLMHSSTASYSIFDGAWNKQWSMATNYSYTWKNAYFFGEWAQVNQSWASLSGMLLYLAPPLSFSVLHRNYPKEFDFRYSQAFSENSTVGNEKGLYVGIQLQPARQWTLKAYADYFEFPWLKFGVDAPSLGKDYLCLLEYKPSKMLNTYVRWKWENKQGNGVDGVGLNELVWNTKQSWRWQLQYRLNDFTLKHRVEWSKYNFANGYLLVQGVRYKPLGRKWAASLRYALFETDDYASRIYAYEPDVLYAFSVPAHYGSGQRYLLVLKYRFHKKLSAWIRFSETAYFDRTSVKSGWEALEGNKLTEVKFLLRYTF